MTITDLRTLNWGFANWTNCPCDSSYPQPFVSVDDIELFVNYTFKEIARKANIPYNESLISFLKEENAEFYEYLSRHTKPFITPIPRREYESLKKLFIIPKIDKKNITTCNNAQNIINEFEKLSDIDKLKVLEHHKLKEVIVK